MNQQAGMVLSLVRGPSWTSRDKHHRNVGPASFCDATKCIKLAGDRFIRQQRPILGRDRLQATGRYPFFVDTSHPINVSAPMTFGFSVKDYYTVNRQNQTFSGGPLFTVPLK